MNSFAFLTYMLVTTFTRGPNNMMAMSNGLHDGFQKSIRFLLGVFVGFFFVMILYGITVFSSFIIPFYQDIPTLTHYSVVLAVIGFMATACWAAFGVIFRTVFSKYSTIIIVSPGLLLIYSAIAGFCLLDIDYSFIA